MANPSSKWDFIPVFGVYLKIDNSPSSGTVSFTLADRITRVDGRLIYPGPTTMTVTIGNTTQHDATIRSTVRAAWRAADAAAAGGGFDGTGWDTWWDTVVVPAAIFTSFPASDDPDIVQRGYAVTVKEALQSGGGKTYSITPLTTHLDLAIPGINLGLIEVPPGSPSNPAPMYAKGIPGGVAALNYLGQVVDADGDPVTGGGSSAWADITGKPSTFPPSLPITEADVTGLVADLAAKAADSAVVKLSGAQTVTGVKTFSSAPVVPAGAFTATAISDFTEAAQDAIAALLAGASGVTLSYNDAGNSLTITGPGSTVDPEQVRDLMGVALVASGLISITVNDALDTITISTTATANSTDAALRDRSTHTGSQLASTISDFAETVDDRVAAATVAGSGITKTYDDTANTLTIAAGGGVPEMLLYNGTNIIDSAGTTISSRPTTRPLILIGGTESIRPAWMNNQRDVHLVTAVP